MAEPDITEFIDDLPIDLSFRDMLEPTDYMFGDDFDAPEGRDGEDLGWKGELIDGFPIEEKSIDEIRGLSKKDKKARLLRAQLERELEQVEPGHPETVRVYIAGLRAARRFGMPAADAHRALGYERVPSGLERLAEMGFAVEARYAAAAVEALNEQPERTKKKVPVDRVDVNDSNWQEARLHKSRRAAIAREANFLRFADQMTTNLLPNDRVKLENGLDTGVVQEVQADGKVRVTRDLGGDVTYDTKAVDDGGLQRTQASRQSESRVAARAKSTLVKSAIETPTHAPKGMHSVGPKGDKSVGSGDVVDAEDDLLRPEKDCVARLTFPNIAAFSAAVPKLAQRDWWDGVERLLNRAGGSWDEGDRASRESGFEMRATFPTEDSARRFAKRLVDDYHVQPKSIEAALVPSDGRFLRMGLIRVDTAHRVVLPGGVVFALEGYIQPNQFQVGEHVIVMDPMSQALAEGIVAAVGPDVAVVTASDGTQYEYQRNQLRRLTLARLNLIDAPLEAIPDGQKVVVGNLEGILVGLDDDVARVRTIDGPIRFPRGAVHALVRVADLS